MILSQSQLLNLGNSKVPNMDEILKSPSKKKRKSIIDELEPQQIVVPTSIQEDIEQQMVQEIVKLQDIEQIIQQQKQKYQQEQVEQNYNPEQVEQIKQQINLIRDEPLPENVNVVEIESDVYTSLNEIPDGNEFDISDIEVKVSETKKDKSGYYKTKINIKSENIPEQINNIASYVKYHSKGLIGPRVCDLRVIGNTNKTQLRGSSLKLSTATIVFKPNPTKLKVNKGTRFMISVPEDYDITGNLLIYIQESRNKIILELTAKDFPTIEHFNEFIGDRIVEYYILGYVVVLKKLELRNVNNPLMTILTTVLKTKEYKGKPYVQDSHIYAIEFISVNEKNQWLSVKVNEVETGLYQVELINNVDSSWKVTVNKAPVTISKLEKNILNLLNESFEKDWDLSGTLDEIYYSFNKLKHGNLKSALLEINQLIEDEPERGIIIKKVLSKKDTAKLINGEYAAESIIGKTNFIDYYILTYLAYQIIGGDKRKGEEYITRQQYYEKYDVKDRRDYEEREKTILKKEGTKRNYNSREFLFQLEYSVDGKKHIYRVKTWQELIDNTGFLTDEPKFPKNQIL
jgi:hypothetical protein